MPLAILALEWDPIAESMTIVKTRGSETFFVSDIPQSIKRTVEDLQTWCDAHLQDWFDNRGFTQFIKVKVRSVAPMVFDFVVADTQAALDDHIFKDIMPPPDTVPVKG